MNPEERRDDMSRVFVSFLGKGSWDRDKHEFAYKPTTYVWSGGEDETPYVQLAELRLLGPFDKVVILGTDESRRAQWDGEGHLAELLRGEGIDARFEEISAGMSPGDHWSSFETLLDVVRPGDSLTIDMTHGFRAVPIVFSTALSFLRLARDVTVEHVLYGAFQHGQDKTPIVDMAAFYVIDEWADGVSRLVQQADASKLTQMAQADSLVTMPTLGAPELAESLERLTAAVRNVEVNEVSGIAREVLGMVERTLGEAPPTGERVLLELVRHKFADLATAEPLSGRYDADYFGVQLSLVQLLIEHGLYMQAYTAMRELVGSMGLMRRSDKWSNNKGRKKRRYASLFIAMVEHERAKWDFPAGEESMVDALLPWYEELAAEGVVHELFELGKDMSQIRNGFAHAWTSKKLGADLEKDAHAHSQRLEGAISGALESIRAG